MPIVDFNQITQRWPWDATKINPNLPLPASIAMGPITGDAQRTTLYDPLWGYFLFTERTTFVFNEAYTYQDVSEFQIDGLFTRHAEGFQDDAANDGAAFNALTAKYEALRTALTTAAMAVAPVAYGDWCTTTDPRMIKLPEPLRTKDGKNIFAIPVSCEVQQSVFANFIAYKAVVQQLPLPAKLAVNGVILDGGTITIEPPAPILRASQMVGAAGAVFQLRNYTSLQVTAAGTLPHQPPAGQMFSQRTSDLIASLNTSKMRLSVQHPATAGGGASDQTFLDNLDAEEPRADVDYGEQVVQFSVQGKGT